jgi:hypothetical protein
MSEEIIVDPDRLYYPPDEKPGNTGSAPEKTQTSPAAEPALALLDESAEPLVSDSKRDELIGVPVDAAVTETTILGEKILPDGGTTWHN